MNRTLVVVSLMLGAGTAACSSPRAGAPDGTPDTASRGSDTATLARLEREARALARTDGCAAADQCRAAPVGARPCGGPRDYIVYCARSTDSVALFRKLDSLQRAETEHNQRTGAMGTCEFRMPPRLSVEGSACRAVP